ncbi:MAG: penicillin-binding protein 2 [Bacteroidia bacterium]|nr:penicillin-binding protein 2 [Bacteroidia bacterium]
MMENLEFAGRRRAYILGGLIVFSLALLVIRLVDLQFLQYESFRSTAEKNSIRQQPKSPLRGNMYDRDGALIVENNPSYTLTITPFEFQWHTLPLLVRLFDVDTNLVRYRVTRAGINSFDPVKILPNLSFAQVSLLEENRTLLPGVGFLIESTRRYNLDARMAHLLGYTKEISPTLLRTLGEYYQPGDIVGFNGIEAYYEPILRGRKGYGYHTVNAMGRVVESFEHGRSDIPAREGADLFLSIDQQLQRYGEQIMRNRRGAIVAMDPRNGEVLAFVSAPDYDLNDLSGKISPEVWNGLIGNPAKPMYNRCSMAAYPPGSTFKMLVAVAALQEGIIDPDTKIHCPGSYPLAGKDFRCHGAHGNVGVVAALEYSCNVFFYKLIFKLGFANLQKYGALFHFGRPTGMDISNESAGIVPSEEYYNRRYGTRWNIGYLVNLGIGQGEVNTTPLQMAAYTAAIANGGTYYTPHAVRKVRDRFRNQTTDIPVKSEKLPISREAMSVIQRGMLRVVHGGGTGYAARVSGVRVAGKTGTAQNPPNPDHAWFVGYAPFEEPTIAVAVIVENGGFGGSTAAPIAAAMIRQYLYPQRREASSVRDSTEVAPAVEIPVVHPSHPVAD